MGKQKPDRIRTCFFAGLVFAISFIILDFVTFSGVIVSSDISVFKFINNGDHTTQLDSAMILLSDYGREVVWSLVVIGLIVFGGKKERKTAITLILLVVILAPLGAVVKAAEPRGRPYAVLPGTRLLVSPENDSSFPSGHTLIVAGGAVVALVCLRKAFSIPLTIEAALVSYSRIYVGVHYPTDVIAGALLGTSVAFLLLSQSSRLGWIYERLPIRGESKDKISVN